MIVFEQEFGQIGDADGESKTGEHAGRAERKSLHFVFIVKVGKLDKGRNVKEVFTTSQSHENAELVLGDYILKTGLRHLLLPNGQISKLTEKEVRILRTLHRAKGQAVPSDELLSEIWGYDSRLTTHTLETHIYRLRQKSENAGEGPELVLTEAGGYRLAV